MSLGVALGPDEVDTLRNSPLLYQEFHALAFCSETIRQIDLRNCTKSLSARLTQQRTQVPSLQFLTPILHLLRSGITKCNHLILGGNTLPQSDIEALGKHLALSFSSLTLTLTFHSGDNENRHHPFPRRLLLRPRRPQSARPDDGAYLRACRIARVVIHIRQPRPSFSSCAARTARIYHPDQGAETERQHPGRQQC